METLSPDTLTLVWKDETGNNITMHLLGDLPVAHFDFKDGFAPSNIKYYEKVIVGVDVALQEAGLDRYCVLVGSQKDYDFARWMGCSVTGTHVENTRYEILERVLTQ